MLTVRAKAYKKEWTDKWRKTDVGIQYWKNHYRKPHVIQRIKKYKKTEFFKIGVLLANARKRAKVFGIPFSIGRDDIKIPKFCPIFGVELIWGDGQPKFNSPSLDRIDPLRGYVQGNVSVISWRANTIKNNGTAEEHRLISEYISMFGLGDVNVQDLA